MPQMTVAIKFPTATGPGRELRSENVKKNKPEVALVLLINSNLEQASCPHTDSCSTMLGAHRQIFGIVYRSPQHTAAYNV